MELFNAEKPQELPKHLQPIKSETSGLLGFTLNLENGAQLKVIKKISSTYGQNLRYLTLIEEAPGGAKRCVNIDMITGDVLKTSSNGRPLVLDNIVQTCTPAELEKTQINKRLSDYAEQIFKTVEGAEAKPAEIIPMKKAVKEINVEDFEDINITKQVEKEFSKIEKEGTRPNNPANPTTEEVKVPKKRGRKPKPKVLDENGNPIKTKPAKTNRVARKEKIAEVPDSTKLDKTVQAIENSDTAEVNKAVKIAETAGATTVNKTAQIAEATEVAQINKATQVSEIAEKQKSLDLDPNARIEKLKQEARTQATSDAKVFAQTYFDTFVEQFQLSMKSQLSGLTTKFTDFLSSLGK